MNNLKKNMVLFLIVIMTLSMVMVPFTPTTQVNPQVSTPQVSTPEQVINDLEKYMVERSARGPLDNVLSDYLETGTFPSNVARNNAGSMGIILAIEPETDMASLEQIVDVNWKIDVGAMKFVSAFVGSKASVKSLASLDGVVSAYADVLKSDITTGIEARPTTDMSTPINDEPSAFWADPHIGATAVNALGYKGAGMRVGVIDTGTDFSIPDLYDAVDIGSDGMPTSYDPTGFGFGNLLYRANATNVNVTEWLGFSSWNVLSYLKDGKYYLNWSSMNVAANTINGAGPRVNNQGGLANLDWWVTGYLAAWWGNAYPNQANLTDFYFNVMRQDPELPHPSTASGGSSLSGMGPYYCAGYVMQQRWNPYMKIFAPAIVLNNTKIVVDWNTTRAHTDFWNLNINYGVFDFNETASWDYYTDMGDWSFADDLAAGYYYAKDGTKEHTIMMFDWPDGRFGLGTLAHTWDPIFGQGMINGLGLGGRQVGIMYDEDAHGTFVAGQIASRGLTDYPIGLGGALEKIVGVAPEATVMGVMTVGIANEFNSMFFAAGFDFNPGTGYFEWNNESAHQMHVTSNSWGWSGGWTNELLALYSLLYATVSTPGYFDPDYPGMVQVFSAGNSGPGYGSMGTPSASQLIHVGATTSYHTFQNSYGPNQGYDQIAPFSSRGGLLLGYPKPDILAPGSNVYGLLIHYDEIFLGINAPTAVYGGTSMACPLVAGSALLVMQAYNFTHGVMPRSDTVKTILQSTARDIGMDSLAQGHGVVDVAAAVDFVLGTSGVMWHTTDSNANWGTEYGDAWALQMEPFNGDAYSNAPPPVDYADASLFFGSVVPGGTASITFHGRYFNSTAVPVGDYDWTPTYYEFSQLIEFTFETYIYNETTQYGHNDIKGGWFNLTEKLTSGQLADLYAAKYATIHMSGDAAVFDDDYLWAFVFDWDDTDVPNGVPDYYNTTTGLGDELTRWQYGGDSLNNIKMDLSHPDGIGNLFPNTGIVMVHDDTIWSWPYTSGNILTVRIVLWQETVDTQLALSANPAGGIFADLTVDAGADFGVHQGFIAVEYGPSLVHKIPYTYNVMAEVNTHDGSALVIADGAGDAWTPYDPTRVNAGWDTYYTYRSSDHGTYLVDVTDAAVTNLVVRVDWVNPDTDISVVAVSTDGMILGSSFDYEPTTTNSKVLVLDISGPMKIILSTGVDELEGPLPEDYTITVYGYDDAMPAPSLSLSYYSNDNPTVRSLAPGGTASGDHVWLNATWTYPAVGGIPEFVVTDLEMKVLYGTLFESGPQPLVDNLGTNPFSPSTAAINPAAYAWVSVPVSTGDNVRVTVDFTNGDCDIMAWYASTAMASRSYSNNILGGQMATGAHPEYGTFTATSTENVEFAILNFDNQAGTFELTLDNRAGLEPARVLDDTFELDTFWLFADAPYSVLIDSYTGTNIHYRLDIPVVIDNFVNPVVTVDAPTEISTGVFNITWTSVDVNAAEVQYYYLWLSNNGGQSYQLLRRNLTESFYVWDSSGYLETSYIARVVSYSLDFTNYTALGYPGQDYCGVDDPPNSYWPGNFAEGLSPAFDAGDVPPPITTTTPPPTTTTTPPPPPPIDPLLIGLVGGIGVGVVVILILFLIRKK